MTISLDTVVVRDNRASAVNLHGGLVVFGMNAGAYFDFNQTGEAIWELLANSTRMNDLLNGLLEAYCVPPNLLTTDLFDFIQYLIDHHLVLVVSTAETI